jgi:hypothetical protein
LNDGLVGIEKSGPLADPQAVLKGQHNEKFASGVLSVAASDNPSKGLA